jgi:hypothetical protein
MEGITNKVRKKVNTAWQRIKSEIPPAGRIGSPADRLPAHPQHRDVL